MKNIFGQPLGQKLPPMHLVCSTDNLRQAMQCVHIENGIATATNGHSLIRYDISGYLKEETLKAMDGRLIHKKKWELMCKATAGFIKVIEGKIIVPFPGLCDITMTFNDETYPNFHAITSPLFSGELTEAKERISLNIRLLKTISDVLGHIGRSELSQAYRFFFNKGQQAIVITHAANDEGVAILMPVLWDMTGEAERNRIKRFMKP